jgi:hypothetical protein
MFALFLFVIGIIIAVVHMQNMKQWHRAFEILLLYQILLNIGVMGICTFLAQSVFAEYTAQGLNWPIDSSFQYELASSNLAFGVLGILAIWYRKGFWLATVLGQCIISFGEMIVHHYFDRSDHSLLNVGVFVWAGDVFVPIALLVLLAGYVYSNHPRIAE